MPMPSRLTAAALVALSVLATHAPPAAAWLAGPPGAQVLAWVCHADYARFCRGVPTGTGQALRCLAERHHAISTPCGRALKVLATIEACANDFDEHCPGVVPGAGRGAACLEGNFDRLSRDCVRALRATFPYHFYQSYVEHYRSRAHPRDYGPSDDFTVDPPDLDDAPLK